MILLSTNGRSVARAEKGAGSNTWKVDHVTLPVAAHAVSAVPGRPSEAFAGTSAGVYHSTNGGASWQLVGLEDRNVRAIAVSPVDGALYAGTRRPALFVSRDGGETWKELPALRRLARWRAFFSPAEWPPAPYVSAIAVSPKDARRLVVGFEVGGVAWTADGGETWHVGRGAIYDCHSLSAHSTDGMTFYQGGAGLAKAGRVSRDGGATWSGPIATMSLNYGWACCASPTDPSRWFYAASDSPFKAHRPGKAEARIFTIRGPDITECEGGLPEPLSDMPYQMVAAGDAIMAFLINGDVWRSDDDGETWRQVPVNLGRIERSATVLA